MLDFGTFLVSSKSMNKRVAISIWNDRVSPVMDFARQLAVIDFQNDTETSRRIIDIPDTNHAHKAEYIKSLDIDLLICGAISMPLYQMLTASHIEVRPFIKGTIQNVLMASFNNDWHEDRFFLPGCRRNAMKLGGWGHHGHGRCRRRSKEFKED